MKQQKPSITHLPQDSCDPLGAERRIHPRIYTPPLYVSNASVRDVSLGGICLNYETQMSAGERETLILTDGLSHYTAELPAEVVWAVNGIAGLRWTGLTPGEESWLRERFTTWVHSQEAPTPTGTDLKPAYGAGGPYGNRRKYERIENPPLSVTFVPARVRDISLGGICLVLEQEEELQDRYELLLTGGLYYFSEEITAELVWKRGNKVGLRWSSMDQDQRRRLQSYFEQWRDEPLELLMRANPAGTSAAALDVPVLVGTGPAIGKWEPVK